MILALLNRLYFYIFDRLILYRLLSYLSKRLSIDFLNLGYLPITNRHNELSMLHRIRSTSQSTNVPHICLYEKCLSLCPIYPNFDRLRLLEIGCGHGGGIRWFLKYIDHT